MRGFAQRLQGARTFKGHAPLKSPSTSGKFNNEYRSQLPLSVLLHDIRVRAGCLLWFRLMPPSRLLVLTELLILFGDSGVPCMPSQVNILQAARNLKLTNVTGLFVPKLFVRIFLIPAASQTARTAAPAIIPVPAPAGTSSTLAAPKRP